ncbi:M20/M25/M40 family metallo-hydrolase [Embleya hyalina]|uniref:Putative lipoprotein aminopeptidase LpqL n=1 Tax=Embleya hyalina TaxID=516124 RepID=A0A401Z1T1_9ACTN|nr:M20/M25/M40 family metallo-hydrolase [Embleya hyalina]GCE00736.1 putative lipoprotein aminopeptidase LpqL [Embleya hyalina]
MTAQDGNRVVEGVSRRRILGAMTAGAVASAGLAGRARAYGSPVGTPSAAGRVTAPVKRHMAMLDTIAARHGGNRAAGLPGYTHSALYVEEQLRRSGYRTRRQPFGYDRTDHIRDTVEQVRPRQRDVFHTVAEGVAASPAGGDTGELVIPRDAFGDAADSWEGIDARGKVALLQLRPNLLRGARREYVGGGYRGGGVTARHRIAADQTEAARRALIHARAAGITAALFYLDQADIPIGLFFDAPGDTELPPTGVVFSSDATALREDMKAGGATVRVELELRRRHVDTFNVLTELPDATADRHLIGAHLDSVPQGPGIDDNGSGSALLLHLAHVLAAEPARAPVRFCWWGGEEDGMRGSRHFVETEPLRPIRAYFNMDMVAAPNHVIGVYGNGPQRHFTDHFTAIGQPWLDGPVDGMSDQVPFLDAGIPVAGIDTVRSAPAELKNDREAELFGGTVGQPFDPRYHTAGDTITNVGIEALAICTTAGRAALRAISR